MQRPSRYFRLTSDEETDAKLRSIKHLEFIDMRNLRSVALTLVFSSAFLASRHASADLVTITFNYSAAGLNETELQPQSASFSFTTEALDACVASGACVSTGNLNIDVDALDGISGIGPMLVVTGSQIAFFTLGDHTVFYITDPTSSDILDFEHPVSFTGDFAASGLQGDCDQYDPACRPYLSAVSPTATADITITPENSTVTPEPGTWVMVGTGLLGGWRALRRRG